MADEKRTVVKTGRSGAGWFLAVLLILVVAAGAYFLYADDYRTAEDLNIESDVPSTIVPPEPIDESQTGATPELADPDEPVSPADPASPAEPTDQTEPVNPPE